MASEEYPWQDSPSSRPLKRGAFIVVEGVDRAGKTTQVKKLCDVGKQWIQRWFCSDLGIIGIVLKGE